MGILKHIHLEECSSTQDELKKYLSENSNQESILISTSRQVKGRGRRNNKWLNVGQQIALSIAIKPHLELTLTPLEISILSLNFLMQKYRIQLSLKWPNDLLNSKGSKVGGILCEVSGELIIVGIGINIHSFSTLESLEYPADSILEVTEEICLKDLSFELANFILSNRHCSVLETIEAWNSQCIHLNRNVIIQDNESKIEGVFQSLGTRGEAMVLTENKLLPVFTGSLRFSHS